MSPSAPRQADLARERGELATQPEAEHAELTRIDVSRGLAPILAAEVLIGALLLLAPHS